MGLRMCEGWEGEFLGVWNCLLKGTEVKRMSSWLVVELKFQSLMVKETALGSDAWIQILGLLFTCCVTSVTLLNLSVPQFPNL